MRLRRRELMKSLSERLRGKKIWGNFVRGKNFEGGREDGENSKSERELEI